MSESGNKRTVERYDWLSFDLSSTWKITLLFTLAIVALSIFLFVLYCYFSADLAPDSVAGYTCAIVGTLFMLLAALSYTRYRRSLRRKVGRLNVALHWHISFGLLALVVLFLHSFGNFNPRTGTYALWGIIALVISGAIGRILSRVLPMLIAHGVGQVLTDTTGELSEVKHVLRREEYYRSILDCWRICHVLLAFITLGLTLWHLEYAATLLLPTFFRSIPSLSG